MLRGDDVLIEAVYCFRQVSGVMLGVEQSTKFGVRVAVGRIERPTH
jgi:hypothetical protein